jgi:outer membrane lipopolysaccharide assembly protein LptE/RlpB
LWSENQNIMNRKKKIYCLVFLGLFISLTACGYRFRGGGNLPGGIKTVSVKIFENNTSETGIENIFTNDFIYEITRNKAAVLTDPGDSEAEISGTLTRMSIETISHEGINVANERRVTVYLDLLLTKSDGEILHAVDNISEYEDYAVAGDKLATEKNRRDAIIKLSKRLSEKVYGRLTDNF